MSGHLKEVYGRILNSSATQLGGRLGQVDSQTRCSAIEPKGFVFRKASE